MIQQLFSFLKEVKEFTFLLGKKQTNSVTGKMFQALTEGAFRNHSYLAKLGKMLIFLVYIVVHNRVKRAHKSS